MARWSVITRISGKVTKDHFEDRDEAKVASEMNVLLTER